MAALRDDHNNLAATGREGLVHLYDVATGEDVLTLRGFAAPRPDEYSYTACVVFSPEGTRIAANNWDGSINIWDARSKRKEEVAVP